MKRSGPNLGSSGFALVEAIVATVLLAVGVLGFAAAVGAIGSQMRASHLATQLRARGQTEMEGLLAAGYERLAAGDRREGSFRIQWTVSDGELRELQLIVSHRIGVDQTADTFSTLVWAP